VRILSQRIYFTGRAKEMLGPSFERCTFAKCGSGILGREEGITLMVPI